MALRKNISRGLVNSVALWGNDMWGSAELRDSMIWSWMRKLVRFFWATAKARLSRYIAVGRILSGKQRLTLQSSSYSCYGHSQAREK
jgi:hypothetical protein